MAICDKTDCSYFPEADGDCENVLYPSLSPSVPQPVADTVADHRFAMPELLCGEFSMPTVFCAAWALIAGQMTGTNEVVFGTRIAKQKLPVTTRVQVKESKTISEYLGSVQDRTAEKATIEKAHLYKTTQDISYCSQESVFHTLLEVDTGKETLRQTGDKLENSVPCALIIYIAATTTHINITAYFDCRIVQSWLAQTLLHRLEFVFLQLNSGSPKLKLADIGLVPSLELDQIWRWNRTTPLTVESCIHEIVQERTRTNPNAPAVCAWDGELTYYEMDKLSSQVACLLVENGVGVETIVPLCFEKSMWTVVAIFAVLKAGGAFVLLDPTLPIKRIQNICQQVHATLGITSVSCESRLCPFVRKTIVLNSKTIESCSYKALSNTPQPGPGNAAYVIFTSGSTGEPKGCVIEHQSYCSAAIAHGSVLGMGQGTRALQFGSYNFAGAIMEILMTLIYGGCVCIPSEEDRATNLVQSIGKLRANWAFLTATVLALLSPENAPTLHTLCVGGEPIRSSQIREWAPNVHLRQTYGSAETAAVVASAKLDALSATTSVGMPTTARCWLVDPLNINRLVPIGVPGEIILEGPVIGRQYVGQTDKSSAAFISAPAWRTALAALGLCVTSSRFYRTGDLAMYKSDGSLELLGRKDTQVKLRGQRIELGEIEHQARRSFPGIKDVAVELARSSESRRGPQLIAFLVLGLNNAEPNSTGESMDEDVKAISQKLREKLEQVLPNHMVPSLFLSVSALPLTVSGKTDRRKLRQMGSAILAQQLRSSGSNAKTEQRQPQTEIEQKLQKIWSKVLQIEAQKINLDNNFFSLGGDSIAAMKLVGEARQIGINLAIADIFRQDTLGDLASQQYIKTEEPREDIENVVLVDLSTRRAILREIDSLDDGICISSSEISDIYPLTSVQELLLANAIKVGPLADYFYVDLTSEFDLSTLKDGCTRTLNTFPILRACFLQLQGKSWQIIYRQLHNSFRVQNVFEDLDESFRNFCITDAKALTATEPPTTFVALRHENQGTRLVVRCSHVQYDAFSIPIILQSIFERCKGTDSSTTNSFATFLSYASLQRTHSIEYWGKLLQDSKLTIIGPKIRSHIDTLSSTPEAVSIDIHTQLQHRPRRITAATLVKTAWALLLSRITGATDVVYGQVVAGRNSALPGMESIVGCCLNVAPERVKFSDHATVGQLVFAVQDQLLAIAEADSLGFNEIIKHCTDWPTGTQFESIIHHRDVEEHPEIQTPEGITRMGSYPSPTMSPFIFLVSHSLGSNIGIRLATNTHIMTSETANKICIGLVRIIEQLVSSLNMPLASWMDSIEPILK